MPEKDDGRRLWIHLDPLGGIAGDMFVAALVDAFPDLEETVRNAIEVLDLGPDGECGFVSHNDGTFAGRRFIVGVPEDLAVPVELSPHRHDHAGPESLHSHAHHDHTHGHAHHSHAHHGPAHHSHTHRRWLDIRELLQDAPLPERVRQHAVSIFQLLAQAEGRVHGVAEDDVTFHEVGAVDSICDIVAASAIIAALPADWSVAPLPLGQGRVRSEHGPLPVPAPATALLLQGFEMIQDGFPGERVTPTGAAIVRYLCDGQIIRPTPQVLERSGVGFGTRKIAGLSNCVRVLVSRERGQPASRPGHRELSVIEFDVDDQTPEDLSVGLDRIRALEGIHDVVQFHGIGKKGRSFAHVRILAAPATLDRTIEACFAETTTIGLRYHTVNGTALPRTFDTVEVEGHQIRVKSVQRPNGHWTAKAESDDAAHAGNRSERHRLRHHAENAALNRRETGKD